MSKAAEAADKYSDLACESEILSRIGYAPKYHFLAGARWLLEEARKCSGYYQYQASDEIIEAVQVQYLEALVEGD